MIKTGIIGAAGYTAGELIRLLVFHPKVEIVYAQSNSQAGKKISDIHTGLQGETSMTFVPKEHWEIDLLFICSGHGKAKIWLKGKVLPTHLKIIDFSHDFRLKEEANKFIYGLPELNQKAIQTSQYIANPGCFATCIQLGLLPLAAHNQLEDEVHIHALTGSTGAGQNPVATTHFSWRDNNVSIYKAFQHQHLEEIKQSLVQLQNTFNQPLNFLPIRGSFSRGIYASIYTNTRHSLKEIKEHYKAYYKNAAFVHIVDKNPHLKEVVNTNKCLIYLEKIDGKILIISLIDNLLKGAAGQAVQNMNLLFGLDQKEGLRLKPSAF